MHADGQAGSSAAVHAEKHYPPFAAVLVMHDPSDWYHDLQLITDVIMTSGRPGLSWSASRFHV